MPMYGKSSDYSEDRHIFADPSGRSALRAGKRNRPCPTCKQKNRLATKDVALGYQCDQCADRAEGTYVDGDY